MRAFQEGRGLRADGICGRQTWSALVEAGYQLGDRLLYLRAPMLRGDDVAELQRRLGGLGFDAGRVDGILGERTVAGVREREALRSGGGSLSGRRVALAPAPELGALAHQIAHVLRTMGAEVITLRDADESGLAAQANAYEAELFLALAPRPEAGVAAAYYGTAGFESAGGRLVAGLLGRELGPVLGADGELRPMTLPALRETRMPAVVCEAGPPEALVVHAGSVAAAIVRAVEAWAQPPADGDLEGFPQD